MRIWVLQIKTLYGISEEEYIILLKVYKAEFNLQSVSLKLMISVKLKIEVKFSK